MAYLALGIPVLSNASTSVDVCQQPAEESRLSIAYYTQEASPFDGSSGETNLENFNTDFVYASSNRWSFGAGHRSTILNEEEISLQTNGYLHTFFFPLHWRQSLAGEKSFRATVAPAFSASSNVASDLDEFTSDAVQLLAAAVWQKKLSDRLDLHYGICGDHRLGRFQVYPVFDFSWLIHPDWRLDIGFPTSRLSHEVSSSLTFTLRISPNGNEWYVKDRDLQNGSRFVYEAFLVEGTVGWRAHRRLLLTVSWGWQFHARYEMTLLEGTRVRLSGDSASQAGLSVAWTF